IATSTDGFTYTTLQCSNGQYCIQAQGSDTAACLTGNCTPNPGGCSQVCGNKVNGGANQTEFVSSCVATSQGYDWVAYQCVSPMTCSPTGSSCNGQPVAGCANNCNPGASRCTNSGVQTCDGTGNWGAVTACDASAGKICGQGSNGQSY